MVTLGTATLSVRVTTCVGQHLCGVMVGMLIENDGTDAVTGTFNGLPEGSELTVSGVTYFITYKYNAEAGTFDDGNDVALCSALVSVLDSPTNPHVVAAAHTTVTNTSVRDASAEHKETSTRPNSMSPTNSINCRPPVPSLPPTFRRATFR